MIPRKNGRKMNARKKTRILFPLEPPRMMPRINARKQAASMRILFPLEPPKMTSMFLTRRRSKHPARRTVRILFPLEPPKMTSMFLTTRRSMHPVRMMRTLAAVEATAMMILKQALTTKLISATWKTQLPTKMRIVQWLTLN